MTDNTTKGRIYTMTSPPPKEEAAPAQQVSVPASGKNLLEQAKNESAGVLEKKWDELKKGLNTVKESTGLGVSPEMASAARERMLQGAKDMAKGLGSLIGAPPELVQAAYISGKPELIATVQQMQAQQTATVQAIADNVKDSVSQAYQRNGIAGASGMVLTMLGTEMLGGKGMGAVMNAAGKAADIVRLSKTPAQAAAALKKEAELARAAGKADDAALFEGAAAEREAQAAREAAAKKTDGVHIKAAFGEKTAHEKMLAQGHEPVGNTNGDYRPGEQGIDGVYKNKTPPPDYIITETKYGTAKLSKLEDGTKQMSDKWVLSSDRLENKVGRIESANIQQALRTGNVEKWLINVNPDGTATKAVLDASASKIGKVIPF
jgi:hypothetical protein